MDKTQLLKNIEEMELKLAEMKKELETKEEKPFPQIGDKYFLIDVDGTIQKVTARDDYGRFQVFKTYNEAKKFYDVECARQRVKDEIKRLNDGWTPDWTGFNEIKYYIKINKDILDIEKCISSKVLDNSMYLKDNESALKIIDSHKDDLLLILGQ